MRNTTFLTLILLLCSIITASAADTSVRLRGGDLSLVPAYETAGDKWLDAGGKVINTTYSDGMITYLRDVWGWNAVRVRLLVDPSKDTELATCQDLAYVKALGKRIKDAGMYFLLDIFYSDTWTDVSQQWIPASWKMTQKTSTTSLANKVKSYTTTTINDLVAYGAAPDYVQIGNEVSYGMLWDSATGATKGHILYPSSAYSKYTTQWTRFAALLNAAAQGVRESNASSAKIVLHTERTKTASEEVNFYTFVQNAGFTDYDVIGLSYYPAWHGTLSQLSQTLNSLSSSFPSKEIHIVETAYYNAEVTLGSSDINTSSTWPFTPAGQAAFMTDLVNTLKNYTNVTGLYYWQPEECGNGANNKGVNQVKDDWDNRGLWEMSWKSGSHALTGSGVLTAMQGFAATSPGGGGGGSTDPVQTDISEKFANMDFENGTYTDWQSDWIWNTTNQAASVGSWDSPLCGGSYRLNCWQPSGTATSAGYIIKQSVANLPAGKYILSAAIHTDASGVYLVANGTKTQVSTTSSWGEAYTVTAECTLTETGTLTIGIYADANAAKSDLNLYADNFVVMQQIEGEGGGNEGGETPQSKLEGQMIIDGIIYYYYKDDESQYAGVEGYTSDVPESLNILESFDVDDVTFYVTYIKEWSLERATMKYVNIPKSISSIGSGAFYATAYLTDVTICGQYLEIGDYAFTAWSDALSTAGEDGNTGSRGVAMNNLTIYAENTDNISISDKAFNADDIRNADLWVVKGLQCSDKFSHIGFDTVYPMNISVGDISTVIASGTTTVQTVQKYADKILEK